jgi:hypothetical protein
MKVKTNLRGGEDIEEFCLKLGCSPVECADTLISLGPQINRMCHQ